MLLLLHDADSNAFSERGLFIILVFMVAKRCCWSGDDEEIAVVALLDCTGAASDEKKSSLATIALAATDGTNSPLRSSLLQLAPAPLISGDNVMELDGQLLGGNELRC